MDLDKFYLRAYDWIIVFAPRLISGIIVLIVGLWIVKLLVRWSQTSMHKREVDPSVKPFLLSLLAIALRVLLILGVMQIIGIEMTLFATVVGAFGVAAGLALSGTLQNFASGILILLLKPFVVGDNIITQGIEGTVTSIQIFYTLIRTFDNRSVIVPNSKLSNELIINISREGSRRLDIDLSFGKDTDVDEVRSVINGAIDKCENILATPERRIGVSELTSDGFKLSINVWIKAHGFQDTKLALLEIVMKDLRASGNKAKPESVT